MNGTIYFIGCTETMRVKIGFTRGKTKVRLAALQTGSPTQLCVMAEMPGSLQQERDLHQKFADTCVRGEWFEMNEELFEHLTLVVWLTAAQCRDANTEIPGWLPVALDAVGVADAFPSLTGASIQ